METITSINNASHETRINAPWYAGASVGASLWVPFERRYQAQRAAGYAPTGPVNDRPRSWGSRAAYDGLTLGRAQATHPATHTPRLRAIVAGLGGFGNGSHTSVSVPAEFARALADAHSYSVQASADDASWAGYWLRSAAFHVRDVIPSIVGLSESFAFSVLQRFAPSSHRAMVWGS